MTTFAVACLDAAKANGATDVFVFPEMTIFQYADRRDLFRNSPEMIDAIDRALLTGELPQGEFDLLPWEDD